MRKNVVGLIVEGDAEFAALPLLHRERLIDRCPPLKPTNVHGIGGERQPAAIGKMLAPKVEAHLIAHRTKVVVCLDREHRELCAPGFAQEILVSIRSTLRSRNRDTSDVHVVIADRAFEAWLLSDAMGMFERGVFKAKPNFPSFEGRVGQRSKLGQVELKKLLGRAYGKTKDGPKLLRLLSLDAARDWKNGRGSRSFDKFVRTLLDQKTAKSGRRRS